MSRPSSHTLWTEGLYVTQNVTYFMKCWVLRQVHSSMVCTLKWSDTYRGCRVPQPQNSSIAPRCHWRLQDPAKEDKYSRSNSSEGELWEAWMKLDSWRSNIIATIGAQLVQSYQDGTPEKDAGLKQWRRSYHRTRTETKNRKKITVRA